MATVATPLHATRSLRGRLKRLAGLFVGQSVGSESAQFVVDKRQELRRGGWISLLDGRQDAGDVAHEVKHNRRGQDRLAMRCAREVTSCGARSSSTAASDRL